MHLAIILFGMATVLMVTMDLTMCLTAKVLILQMMKLYSMHHILSQAVVLIQVLTLSTISTLLIPTTISTTKSQFQMTVQFS